MAAQLPRDTEIVRYSKEGEYYIVQLAVDGVLCVPLEVHASARDCYPDEQSWLDYLRRSAVSLIDLYGDARYPRHLAPPELTGGSIVAA